MSAIVGVYAVAAALSGMPTPFNAGVIDTGARVRALQQRAVVVNAEGEALNQRAQALFARAADLRAWGVAQDKAREAARAKKATEPAPAPRRL